MPGTAADYATSATITPALYQEIARQVRQGDCVLVLGPSAMTAKQPDGSWRPLVELCAEHLAKANKLNLPADDAKSLTQVATILQASNILSKSYIITAIKEFYGRMAGEATLNPIFGDLCNLPFRIIINTAPDNFFVRQYKLALLDVKEFTYNFQSPQDDPMYDFAKSTTPVVYNLFGTYEESSALVLTYSDRLAYIKKATGEQHGRLPDSLLAAFNTPRFYLFMGFDFGDWTLPLLLDTLFRTSRDKISPFAYPHADDPKPGGKTKVFFRSEFRMEFPDLDLNSFAQDLLKYHNDLDSAVPAASSDGDATRANVLLLHHGEEDEKAAKTFGNYLKPLKLRVRTLADAAGEGDVAAWIRAELRTADLVLPLISVDFFSDDNPAYASGMDTEVFNFHQPSELKYVMPVVLRPNNVLATSPLGKLRTKRPSGEATVYDDPTKADAQFAAIVKTIEDLLKTIKK
jgi:hypothetical protein